MKPFLTAEWRNLVMVNYVVPGEMLLPCLPKGVELDYFEGNCYVSFVAFHFLHTKVKGIGFPFHRNFEEINLRFYVKYKGNGIYKRGVVFISELVPKRMIAWIARFIYQEQYAYTPISSSITVSDKRELTFNLGKQLQPLIRVKTGLFSQPINKGSKEEFIFEHYWGYTSLKKGRTGEYKVEHPRWTIYPVHDFVTNADFEKLYGRSFPFLNSEKPDSVFVAEGSVISVYPGQILIL
jgi:hypothetical protein